VGVTEGDGSPCLLAMDAGNSKTDVAVVTTEGTLLARERGPGFAPHVDGVERAVGSLEGTVRSVLRRAGDPRVRLVKACLANADLPVEEVQIADSMRARGWGEGVHVANDTFAVLRAGTDQPRGVAVVCGAGINCVGLLPDGRTSRFLALGHMTGDWGGGLGLAQEVMWWSVRAEDGRGPATALSVAVAAHFVLQSAMAVAENVHLGRIARDRLHELVPLLFRVAGDGDPVARSIVERQAREVVSLASIALRRLRLDTAPADVVLGGGVLTARDPLLMSAITAGLAQEVPLSRVNVLSAPPILGAILLGLEDMAAGRTAAVEEVAAAQQRLRAQLGLDSVSAEHEPRVAAGDARVG
jgi:N-acetylglucosamine kinase-like BadF-type ATPase